MAVKKGNIPWNKGNNNQNIKRICEKCKKVFFIYPYRLRRSITEGRFCSKECWYNSRRVIKKCLKCGKEYKKPSARSGTYCSVSCATSGENNYQWNGGKFISQGYVYILSKGHPNASKIKPYIGEHRLVMEKHLGRYLKKSEVVHHIDGNKSDNRIENLQLFKSNNEHRKMEEEIMSYVKEKFGTFENLKKFVKERKIN